MEAEWTGPHSSPVGGGKADINWFANRYSNPRRRGKKQEREREKRGKKKKEQKKELIMRV